VVACHHLATHVAEALHTHAFQMRYEKGNLQRLSHEEIMVVDGGVPRQLMQEHEEVPWWLS
jgi:hypothetical protein